MNESAGNASHAADTKSSTDQTKAQVLSALFHLERAFLRMAELPMPKDLRCPEQEIVVRIMAAIYEVQAISYPKAANHEQVLAEASLFDDLKAGGFMIRP